MKIYKLYGDNISGGIHNSYFLIIANSLDEARKIAIDYVKSHEYYASKVDSNWKLHESNIDKCVSSVKKGIIHFDSGDCC